MGSFEEIHSSVHPRDLRQFTGDFGGTSTLRSDINVGCICFDILPESISIKSKNFA